MNTYDFRRTWEQLDLSPEAADRIRRVLEAACSEKETEVIHMNNIKSIKRKAPRTAVAAIIAAAILSVTALAVIAARVNMVVSRYNQEGLVDEPIVTASGETEPYNVEISFEEIDGEWIGLGTWYPQDVPDGYEETFVSDTLGGGRNQRIMFENAEGNFFDLEIGTAGPGLEVVLDDVISEQEVTIGEHSGTLFRSQDGIALLAWTDETRGLGFTMSTDDIELDLLTIARSVEEIDTPLTPTLAAEYGKTLAEIGDYTITALPEGYSELNMTASDLSSEWYRYVYRWYENAAHEEIYLGYETFSFEEDNVDPHTAETILSYNGAGKAVTINGLPGGVSDGKIVWVDWERSLVFTIIAEQFTADELTAMAESVLLP